MKTLSKFLISLMISLMMINPVLFAAPTPAELIQSDKFQAGLAQGAHLDGIKFLNTSGDEVSLESLLSAQEKNYSIVSQTDESGNRIGISIKVLSQSIDGVKLAFYLRNFSTNQAQVIDRTTITLKPSDDAQKTKIDLERMIARFQASFEKSQVSLTTVKSAVFAKVMSFFIPSAHAGSGKTAAKIIRVISYIGFGVVGATLLAGVAIYIKESTKKSEFSGGHGMDASALIGLLQIVGGALIGITVVSGLAYWGAGALERSSE